PAAALRRGLRVREQPRAGVGLGQRVDAGRVDVVGMLMGDRDRVQAGDSFESVGERPRIDRDLLAVQFHEQAGVSEMGYAHGAMLCGSTPQVAGRRRTTRLHGYSPQPPPCPGGVLRARSNSWHESWSR